MQADRQTDRQTDALMTILGSHTGGEVTRPGTCNAITSLKSVTRCMYANDRCHILYDTGSTNDS